MLKKVVCGGSQKAKQLQGPLGVPGTWNCDQDKPMVLSFSGVLK